MFAMFNSFFRMLSMLFTTGENFGQALNNLSSVAVSMSEEYAQISDIERRQKIAAKLKELNAPQDAVVATVAAKAKPKAITA